MALSLVAPSLLLRLLDGLGTGIRTGAGFCSWSGRDRWGGQRLGEARAGCGEDPRVLGAAALAGVDDDTPLRERNPGEPAMHDPHAVAVVDRERAEVDMTRLEPVADLGGRG